MASKKGFAAMTPERHREIAKRGGISAHVQGTAHEFTSESAREAGHKGGASVAKRPGHMAEIGRKGGVTVSQNAEHMSRIGKLGRKGLAAR